MTANFPSEPPRPALLEPGEPPPFEVFNRGGASDFVVLCDHASNRVPRRLGTLGLDPLHLAEHIAWDPGAAAVARRLSELLDAPLVSSGYSRLVIDCNRPLRHPDSIAEQSDGVRVPGNCRLTPTERGERIEGLFRPYHDAIDRLLDDRSHRRSLLLSVHSFTPVLGGAHRPWHLGICYGRDRWLAERLLAGLVGQTGILVGDNAPYPIDDGIDYTIPAHGERRGLRCAMLEIRQDLLRTDADAAAWAQRLAAALRPLNALHQARRQEDPPR